MVISEEKKELLRKHFNEDNVIIEYGLNFLDLNTHYVNSIKELNAILDNSENYRYICCHELIPYNNIKDLLNDSIIHGSYICKKNNGNIYYLITSIHQVSETCIGVVLDGQHDSPLLVEDLLKNYIWQDGEYCGRIGKTYFEI